MRAKVFISILLGALTCSPNAFALQDSTDEIEISGSALNGSFLLNKAQAQNDNARANDKDFVTRFKESKPDRSASESTQCKSCWTLNGLFRYTSLNRLAEAEIGFTTNEPVQFCVLQAIELAVAEMIEKGITQGFWKPLNAADSSQGKLMDAS